MNPSLSTLALVLLASSALAKDRASFRYNVPAGEERPVVVDGLVGPQSGDYALRLRYHKPPFGSECGNRCASTTLLLDTDANPKTGLKLADKAPENGADLAILIQGTRDLASGANGEGYLRVRVRRLTNEARNVDDGELLAELDHRKDTERIHVEGDTVFLLIDANNADLPTGRTARLIYHPPGSKPIQASLPGMLSGGGGGNMLIFRHGNWGKVPQAGQRVSPPESKEGKDTR